jgi:urease accessory protein
MVPTSWLVLQIADSAFPVGGFAHSGGLEALAHHRALPAGGVEAHLHDVAWQSGHGSLPFVAAAHRAPEQLVAIDAHLDTTLVSHVANRASRVQGRSWLATAARTFPFPALEVMDRAARSEGGPHHLAAVFGAVGRAIGLAEEEVRRLFLFLTVRGALSAAVRLGLVGPLEAQRIQAGAGGVLDRVLDASRALGIDDAHQTAPLLDLHQATQDRLYSRLFQS